MSGNALEQRGKELENAFFAKLDAKRIEKLRRQQEAAQAKESLAKVSGIADDAVLTTLQEAGITAETLTALSLVPLVAVAWADGTLDGKERKAILSVVADEGIEKQSTAYQLLEGWLEKQPPETFYNVWKEYVQALRDSLAADALGSLRDRVLERAQKVAAASGGFLGMGSKVSDEEQRVLDSLAAAFN